MLQNLGLKFPLARFSLCILPTSRSTCYSSETVFFGIVFRYQAILNCAAMSSCFKSYKIETMTAQKVTEGKSSGSIVIPVRGTTEFACVCDFTLTNFITAITPPSPLPKTLPPAQVLRVSNSHSFLYSLPVHIGFLLSFPDCMRSDPLS